jgi:Uma2 family endonuclease
MSTIAIPPLPVSVESKFDNMAEFVRSLGGVPSSRILWHPAPGTATEQELIKCVEQDKRLCELIDGTLVEKPMGAPESLLAGWLITYLNIYLDIHPIGIALGEAGMLRLFPGRVRMPDVSFISNDKLPGGTLPAVLATGPGLAVEVISEGNTTEEMRLKKLEYFESGAHLMWIIYPKKRTVEVFQSPAEQPSLVLDENAIHDGGKLLPGFQIELKKLFSKLPK